MSVNKVILVGRLGQDPEIRSTASGASVANFSVATNESWVDKSGQRQERTEWHRVVVWGKLADLCGQYLSKGREAYIEGRLQTRQWQDQQGQNRYTTEIQAQTVQFLGGNAQRSQSESSGMGTGAQQAGAPAMGGSGFAGEPSFTEDDIPF